MAATKPFVLICVTPLYGHVMPIRNIAANLVARGYEVTFLSASSRQQLIEEAGATFCPLEGTADYTEADAPRLWAEREKLPPGPEQLAWDFKEVFIGPVADQYRSVQRGLESLKAKDPERAIIVIAESMFLGTIPLKLQAPGLKPTAVIGLGIIPLILSSIDCAPAGPGLPPDASPEGRAKNAEMTKLIQEVVMAEPQAVFQRSLAAVGAKKSERFFLDGGYIYADRFLQMSLSEVEYPRSDLPSSIRFAGGLPKSKSTFQTRPSWWPEIAVNAAKKKIVAVCQGTLAMNYSDLVIPTMQGFKDDPNILVVAVLGVKGGILPPEIEVPSNSRVADYIPFDDLLAHADVFVTNGGYGGFQHALSQGVPLVIGGSTEDKPEVAMRAAWAGVGVNLQTGTPSKDMVQEAVSKVLAEPHYKAKARELEVKMAMSDPYQVVADTVDEMATLLRV
ncbi:MAG: hypothetical protein M1818_007654 [Claussenomyces sp. TS43310]|nr:MAG: hypothetical protein M1818_007654 [Claussenomyces sp. TS43310]